MLIHTEYVNLEELKRIKDNGKQNVFNMLFTLN